MRRPRPWLLVLPGTVLLAGWAAAGPSPRGPVASPVASAPLDAVYSVYAGAESADLVHRIRFGPEGASVDRTVPVGETVVETEGPHGFNTSPDGVTST